MITISEKVAQVTAGLETEREKAIALHDYVCENIKFGFTKYYDEAKPDFTLNCGRGHCNPNTELMVAFFREAGLEAHQHFCTLPVGMGAGIGPSFMAYLAERYMPELSHSYAEVEVEGKWYNIDSYIVDPPLLKSALAKLSAENKSMGYFTRKGATNEWDGKSDAFSQFSDELSTEDHGRVDDHKAYYASSKYRNKMFGLRLNTLNMLMRGGSVVRFNSDLKKLRREYRES